MADVERPQEPIDYDGQRNRRLARRGDRMQLTLARIELAMEGLIAVDRLLVPNQALTNVLHDASGGR
jgi:hypothetical protein